MALPELQSEAVKWQRRLAALHNAGVNPAPALELARTDMSRIAQGGSALPEDQVVSMVYDAYTGQAPISNQQAKHSGTDWNPFHIVSNVMKDAGSDVLNFVPGMVHEGADIVNPHKWEEMFSQLGAFKFGSIGDMAKEVQALPVVGPLVPGMFALSAGTSGITHHPLNFLLDVAAVADVGTKLASLPMDASESATIAAMKEGHPVQAVAKATGLEDKLVAAIQKAGGASQITDIAKMGHYTAAAGLGLTSLRDSQWAYMPVWRAYDGLARIQTRKLRDTALTELDNIIPADLSLEERQKLVIDARSFDPRFLSPTQKPDVTQIARANGDVRTAFTGITNEISAYTTIDPETQLPAPLSWSPEMAKKLDPAPEAPVYEVRVKPADISYENGRYVGRNILPNKFYAHDEANLLQQIRDWSEKYDPRATAENAPVSVVIPKDLGGGTELFPRDSLPVKAQAEYEAAQREMQKAAERANRGLAELDKLKNALSKTASKLQAGKAPYSKADAATKQLNARRAKNELLAKDLQSKREVAKAKEKAFNDAIVKSPPSRYQQLAEGMVRSRLKEEFRSRILGSDRARAAIQGSGMGAALQQLHDEYTNLASRIDSAKSREELAAIVGTDTFDRVTEDAFNDWSQLIRSGYNPIWVHDIKSDWYYGKVFASIRPVGSTAGLRSDEVDKIFDFSPQVLDIHAQLTGQAMEFFQQEATRQFYDFVINQTGTVHPALSLEEDLKRRFPDAEQYRLIEKRRNRDFVEWKNPHDPTGKYYIDKGVQRGLDQMIKGDYLPFKAVRDPVHRVFRVAVLTGARHAVHVAFGGLMMTALEEPGALVDPLVLAHPIALMRAMRTGELPQELIDFQQQFSEAIQSGQLAKGMYDENIDQLHAYRGGSKMAQWFNQSMIGRGIHDVERRVNNIENNLTDMYRGAVYLHKLHGGADNEAALAVVNKTLIDVNNMTPFERTILRQIFPFWSYTKHILRYVLSYPADHPLRASILSHLAQHVQETNLSGDPLRLSKLFFLGNPDKNGKVNVVDFSNLNPFRSMSSVFSMAGFLSGLAPEFQAGLRMYGINTLTGAPNIFQHYTYDAYTGTRTVARPPFNPFDFASAFIPQVEIFDHYLQFTDTMRYLKHNDPEAYRRSLFQEMNLPFSIAPLNIYDVRAKAAAAQYKEAQDALSTAMRTGNTDPLRTYGTVPFQGQLYPADQVANYIDNFHILYPQFAPKSIMRKPKTRKRPPLGGYVSSFPTQPNISGY